MKLSGLARLGIIGTILTCIACFTPVAVFLLGAIGFAAWGGYLDYVLFPLLALFVGLVVFGLVRRQRDMKSGTERADEKRSCCL